MPVPESLVYPSITLLTTRSYLLLGFTVTGLCPILSIHHLDGPPTLFSLSHSHELSTHPTEIHSRLFPGLHRQALSTPIMLLDIRPDPPSSNTPFVHGGNEKRRRPHTTDPSKGVLEFDLLAGGRLFHVHFLRDELVGVVRAYERTAKDGKGMIKPPRPLAWEQWGKENCRIFEAENPVQRAWVRSGFVFSREEGRKERVEADRRLFLSFPFPGHLR